jgi:serine/threonine-protein kinase HipA
MNRARARQDLASWVLFNLLIGNADAHLKNLSFLIDASGVRLAPFCDLVSTESYRTEPTNNPRWPNLPLSTQVGNATTFGTVRAKDFEGFAKDLGLTRTATRRLLGDLTGKIETAADAIIGEFERLNVPRALRAGQLRIMRTIRLIVIREMVAKLKP